MSKPAAFIVAFLTTLVVVLIPVFRTGFVPTEAQGVGNAMPDYEIEVFSGLQNADNVKLSCRWHGGGCKADPVGDARVPREVAAEIAKVVSGRRPRR